MSGCDPERVRFDEFVDGELAQADRAKLERHVAGCARCREELASLRELVDATRALGGIEPARDLYPAIARAIVPAAIGKIEAPSIAGARSSRRLIAGAAAAVLLVALAGSVGWWWRGAARPQPSTVAGRVSPMPASRAADSPALVEMMAATEELADLVEARRGRISPETAAIFERNLAIIDRAIEELRSSRPPGDGGDEALALSAMYRQKLELLRRAGRLSS